MFTSELLETPNPKPFLSTDWETAGNLIAEPSCDPIQAGDAFTGET